MSARTKRGPNPFLPPETKSRIESRYFAQAVMFLIDNKRLAKALRKIKRESKQPADPEPNDDCSRCGDGKDCRTADDCSSQQCDAGFCTSCFNGKMDGFETGIDW